MPTGALRPSPMAKASYYISTISDIWYESSDSLLKIGHLLIQAKRQLPHGLFLGMFAGHLPFKKRTGQMLMRIAKDRRIAGMRRRNAARYINATPCAFDLPPHIGTLYELTRLDSTTFRAALEAGKIHPDMTRKDALALVLKDQRLARHKRAADQNIDQQTSLWLADPPWRTSFKLPYPTMSLEAIRGLRLAPDGSASIDHKYPSVAQASAPCAAIGLWAVDELLHEAEEVLAAWGFEMLGPRIIWDKESHVHEGRAAFMQHEYLLIGVRGGATPVKKPKSVIRRSRAGLVNSEKPVYFHTVLEELFPLLIVRTELFARRTPPKGWRGWGNEYPGVIQVQSAA